MTASEWLDKEFGRRARLITQIKGPKEDQTISFYTIRDLPSGVSDSLIAWDYGNGDGFEVFMSVTGHNALPQTAAGILETLKRNTEQAQVKDPA